MLRRRHHQHDVVAGLSVPVRCTIRLACKRPARMRFRLDAGELGFGHAGIMLERHPDDRAVLIAHRADEGDDGADIAAARFERARSRRRCRNPPAARGSSSSLRSPAGRRRSRARRRSCASWRTWIRSIAARITSDLANALANSGPRAFSQSISSAMVATPSGGCDLFFGDADLLLDPGEIEDTHRATRPSSRGGTRPSDSRSRYRA